jgi:hypothetical protein
MVAILLSSAHGHLTTNVLGRSDHRHRMSFCDHIDGGGDDATAMSAAESKAESRVEGGMRQRDLIVFRGGATAWPLSARAEQPIPTARRLGVLMQPSAQAAKARGFLDAFIKPLQEGGWVEGQNVIIERRFADGEEELLTNLAAELVQLRMDAIMTDSTPSAAPQRSPCRPYRSSWPQVAMLLRTSWWPASADRRQCYRNEYSDERADRQAAATANRDGSRFQACGHCDESV